MRDVSESDDRDLGLLAWICDRCKSEATTPIPDPPLDDLPTLTMPGSPERMAVYEDRVRRGVHVEHPGDYRPAVPPSPSPATGGGRGNPLWGIRRTPGRRGPCARWQVRLTMKGKRIYVGTYGSLAEAIGAREAAVAALGHPGPRRRAG